MDGCSHLSIAEREDIMVRWKGHEGVGQIARELHGDKPAISREIRRNGWQGPAGRRYRAPAAQRRADGRRLRRRRPRLMDEPERRSPAVGLMRDEHWSPEEISGRISEERRGLAVSGSAIHRAVGPGSPDCGLPGHRKAARLLRHHGKRGHGKGGRGRRGRVRITHDISERPEEASSRSRTGDWEGDTVAGGQGGACLVTQAARKAHAEASEATERAPRGGRPSIPSPSTGAGSSRMQRASRRRWERRPASAIPAIHGSGAPTRTPTAFSGTGSRRARASTMPATARCGRCTIHSTGDHASVSSGSVPGRPTTASRCTCSEDSPRNQPSSGANPNVTQQNLLSGIKTMPHTCQTQEPYDSRSVCISNSSRRSLRSYARSI